MASRIETASKSFTFLGGLALGGLLTYMSNQDAGGAGAAVPLSAPSESAPGDSAKRGEEIAEIPPTKAKKHLWIVFGPSGSGKTTMAQFVAQQLGCQYLEGDDFHSAEAKVKMSSGRPLNDNDRWPWLERLRGAALAKLAGDDAESKGIVVTCSALKRRYRDVMRVSSFYNADVMVRFLYLKVSEEELVRRVDGRNDHYMKEDMVKSQVADLEQPSEAETDMIIVDVSAPQSQAQMTVLEYVQERQRVDLV